MKLSDIAALARVGGPVVGGALKRGQLFRPACELFEPPSDVLCEYEVRVPRPDGSSLTANVFRSKTAEAQGEQVPVVMCAHPYDNSLLPALGKTPFGGPPQQFRIIRQSGGTPRFSTITSWESPDPAFWVPNGYAVVNLNLPGYASSDGTPTMFSEDQGKAFYEAIEWVASQPWCNGNIGLSGVSFLAISQYYVAACEAYGGSPPALKCISPWEGLSDPLRDIFLWGGIPEVGFTTFWWYGEVNSVIKGRVDEYLDAEGGTPIELPVIHPFEDDFWRSKVPNLEEIQLPMLVCGSFSDHNLHTNGSFRAFDRASSEHKWLYTHRSGKWVSYYSNEVLQMTKAFMDCFLKENGQGEFLEMPPVRLEVRSTGDQVYEVRQEHEWPLARTNYIPFYLDANSGVLTDNRPPDAAEAAHDAHRGQATFTVRFIEDTEVTGHMKLAVWVEARQSKTGRPAPQDLALFVAVNKLNVYGKSVRFNGTIGAENDMVSRGQALASWRELDEDASTPWLPVFASREARPLEPGEVVRVDIPICPSSTHFAQGESLQLIVGAQEVVPTPPFRKKPPRLGGSAVIHTGADRPSHLLVPMIPTG